MIFPDGTKREGYFENNVYKLKVQISDDQEPSDQDVARIQK
jgi:hypothetical protein